ncbi:hypothetical protein EDD16DRAFT_1525705 [Pisolithus croceorrhizus]|nr:hypothetical protein EDD16DRAFT_1525705 [Pisolithus croceorrhizus]KAI6160861.1 hypothetical protein EDD17DRAFT_1509733 [Pisolithus thermaeus]
MPLTLSKDVTTRRAQGAGITDGKARGHKVLHRRLVAWVLEETRDDRGKAIVIDAQSYVIISNLFRGRKGLSIEDLAQVKYQEVTRKGPFGSPSRGNARKQKHRKRATPMRKQTPHGPPEVQPEQYGGCNSKEWGIAPPASLYSRLQHPLRQGVLTSAQDDFLTHIQTSSNLKSRISRCKQLRVLKRGDSVDAHLLKPACRTC